ncbi:MAG: EAL domain-containing protein [Gammaproteobacteria bacterium]|nr:EAL domain-containing protein [Gammaproteobacteria bacterium]
MNSAARAIKLFTEVINGMDFGVSFRYELDRKDCGLEYLTLHTKSNYFGRLVVTDGKLEILPREHLFIVNNCAKILAVVLEYHADHDKQKLGKISLQKVNAVKSSEEYKNQVMSKTGSWSFEVSSGCIEWSDIIYQTFGLRPQSTKITQKIFLEYLHIEDRNVVKQFIRGCLRKKPGSKSDDLTFRIVMPGSEIKYVSVNAKPVFDVAGRLTRLFGTLQDVTESKQVELTLQNSHNLLRSIIDAVPMWIAAFDLDGRYLAANKYFEKICELPLHKIEGGIVDNVLPETFLDRHMEMIQRCLAGDAVKFYDELVDGEFDGIQHIAGNYAPLIDERENIVGVVGAFNDVSDLVQARTDLQKTEAELHKRLNDLHLYAEAFRHTAEGIVITDVDECIVEVNRATERMLGFTKSELLGKTPRIWKSNEHDNACYKDMWDSIAKNDEWHGELWNRRKSGEVFPARVTINAIKDGDGKTQHYIAILSDITNLVKSQERLDYLAHHDPLTELPNRLLFNARLEHAVKHAARKKSKLALLFLDLDRFKLINDRYGHRVGDELLKAAGKRLTNAVRMDDAVARNGGDEFTMLVEEIDEPADAALVAEKVLAGFEEPFELLGNECFISTSIGISIYPDDSDTVDGLMQNADNAMYRAKDAGRNGYAFFCDEITAVVFERVFLESSIKRALENDEFVLYFQPQVEIQSGEIVGVEVLLRWDHPDMGTIGPRRFIQPAEDSGMIVQLSEWVLHKALSQGKSWIDQKRYDQRICVNVSAVELYDDSYEQKIIKLLDETGFPAKNLELEIKEAVFLNDFGKAAAMLERLKKRGISMVIDDFGVGYSSLSHLQQLPVDKLKIDRSFICDTPGNQNSMTMAKTVIGLGSTLGLKVIAEGVETQSQRDSLLGDGCNVGQGFYFARPMLKNELERKFDA